MTGSGGVIQYAAAFRLNRSASQYDLSTLRRHDCLSRRSANDAAIRHDHVIVADRLRLAGANRRVRVRHLNVSQPDPA